MSLLRSAIVLRMYAIVCAAGSLAEEGHKLPNSCADYQRVRPASIHAAALMLHVSRVAAARKLIAAGLKILGSAA